MKHSRGGLHPVRFVFISVEPGKLGHLKSLLEDTLSKLPRPNGFDHETYFAYAWCVELDILKQDWDIMMNVSLLSFSFYGVH